MAFRTHSLRTARPAREFQLVTRPAPRSLLLSRCGSPAATGRTAGAATGLLCCVLSCASRVPVELEPLAPGPTPSFATRLAGIDVAHVDLYGGIQDSYQEGSLRVATIEGSVEVLEIDGQPRSTGSASQVKGYSLGGHPVRLSFEYGRPSFDDEGAPLDSTRVTVDLAWMEAPAASPAWAAGELLKALDPSDSATVWIHGRGVASSRSAAPERLGLAPMLLHAQRVQELASLADAEALAAIPAGAPFAEAGEEPRSQPALEAFLEFCEAELLVRRGRGGLSSVFAPADAWFGGTLTLKAGDAGESLRSLAGAMHRVFLQGSPKGPGWGAAEVARLHQPSVTDEWAVPRLLLMRQMMGESEFRSLLRSFIDNHRGGDAVGWEEFAAAAEDAAPGFGSRFVRSWLRNSREPRVKTRWTYDESRGRVLLRVDQVHELQGGASAPAYPFLLPVRVTTAAGEVTDHLLEVDKRRDLLEVPSSETPAQLDVDPDGLLGALMSMESAGSDSTEAK